MAGGGLICFGPFTYTDMDAIEGANNDPALLALGILVGQGASSLTGAGFAAATSSTYTSSGLAAGLVMLMQVTAQQVFRKVLLNNFSPNVYMCIPTHKVVL